ncbi:cupin domain-containing protein [Actinacidiphila bryophytorum]|uniref:cupin domain-containing protein n=1 Tax=Actinacidiphila bryophytorum TaxID=1436133 RepID=UPI002176A53D|nr:cupin domain-containing protein [Actinacidiphila bryophytorum]UWE13001.1 cupin domain-containing protein [Actinacidiphila bryophytorum]
MTDHEHADVTIRANEPDHLERAHGLDLRLLHPWPGLDSPFRGAWCVLRPGDVSELHSHHDREIFIVMSGRGTVLAGGSRQEVAAGDLAYITPDVEHSVVNEHDEDFAYYAIWWDPAMSADFLASQGQAAAGRAS